MYTPLFLFYCEKDNIVSVKNLYKLGVITSNDINEAINKSSTNFKVLSWLCSLKEANLDNILLLFVTSCGLGKYDLINFMIKNIIHDKYIIKCGIILACTHGHLEIMKLLYNDELLLHAPAYFQSVSSNHTENLINASYDVFTGPHTGSTSCFKTVHEELCNISKLRNYNDITNWLNSIN